VVLYLPGAELGAFAERERWRAAGIAQSALLAVLRAPSAGWKDDDEAVIHAVRRAVRAQHGDELPLILVGQGDGARLVQAMGLSQPLLYRGIVMIGGASGGRWPDTQDRVAVGLYASANATGLAVRSMQAVADRLRRRGHQVHWASGLSGDDYDPAKIAELIAALLPAVD
jgi:predicted esterase